MNITYKALLVFAVIALSGCVTVFSEPENMVYKGSVETYDAALKTNIEIGLVSGGKEIHPGAVARISDKAFATALKETLELQGLLSSDGRYNLEVSIRKVVHNAVQFAASVTISIKYVLTDTQTNNVVIKEIISAHHTEPILWSIKTPVRLAIEGAANNNIELFLFELSKLKI